MKPVQEMLNFLWKKTSRKSTAEPPIIQASSVNGGSYENVHRFKQKAPAPRPTSMYVEGNGNIPHPVHVKSASTSLDEHSFLDTCVEPHWIPNQNRTLYDEADTYRGEMPCRNASKNKSESQLNSLGINNEPAKYYNSPKISQRYQPNSRNSGHSRSHSVYTNVHQVNPERAAKPESEGTPRMYKKNPLNSNKVMPHFGGLTNVSFDGSTTGSVHSDSQGSQWSFWEDGCTEPVPPPRKRRGKPREAFSETSSQSSTDRSDISKVAVTSGDADDRRLSEDDPVSPVSVVQDPMEFSLCLPPGFSDLGLDMMGVEFNAEEVNSGRKPTNQNNGSPEQCAWIPKDDVLRLESTRSTKIIISSSDADSHLSHDSDSSDVSDIEETIINSVNSDTLPQATKLRSETIVKSIFAKGRRCRDSVLDSDSVETEEQTQFVLIDANTAQDEYGEQSHDVSPETLPEFLHATENGFTNISENGFTNISENGFTNISEYRGAHVEPRNGKHRPWCHESSTDDVFYTPVSDETDWTIAFCSSGATQRSCGNDARPDVLIGTHQKALSSSVSSLQTDSDQSVDSGQEDNREVEVCTRLLVEKDLGHDLVVFHQLQGSPSSIVVKIGETCTAQDVIEQILHLENLPADWYLYKLCTKAVDTTDVNNGCCVSLGFRDCPLMHVTQKNRGGNVRFELHEKDGIQIRVTCDAGLERTRTLAFGISCDETCENVLDIAAQKFGLNGAAKLCLIQVERNEKGCPMKRVPENQIIAQLHSNYFLLCEREFLAGASADHDQSFTSSARTRSRTSCSPGSPPSTVEFDRLQRKVADLETKLVEREKICRLKLLMQQNQLNSYRAIAFCTDPVTKQLLLETEIQRLTIEMREQEQQMQMYSDDLRKTSSQSECEGKNHEDELAALKKSLSALEKERTEVHAFLTATRTEELEAHKTSASKKVSPPLYSICREYQGGSLYSLELNQSSLLSGEEHLPLKNDINHVGNGRNNTGLGLMEGDRILEINGQPVHHLNEKELLSVVGEMTENLHVVVLRKEKKTTDIYVL